jgi:hypothetical protein
MRLLIIFGPPAAGKKSIGTEISLRTKFKLFHNHLTIDLLSDFFPFGSVTFRTLVEEFRYRIIEEASQLQQFDLIFTFVWNFNDDEDAKTVNNYRNIVELNQGEIYLVELQASLEERLKRNRSENRFKNRKKFDLNEMEEMIKEWEGNFIMESNQEFKNEKNYLKINNDNLSASEVADIIIQHFNFHKPIL